MRPVIRVLVADADEEHRDALAHVLAAEPDLDLVPAATRAEVASTPGVDVVLLVGSLDAPTAADALETRTSDGPQWVVIVDEVIETDAVLMAGAHGCLIHSSTPMQIVAAVRAAAAGHREEPVPAGTGPLVQMVRREVSELTDREVEVLRLVAAGLGNQAIAERLYLSLSSVKSHLSHTYGRLGVNRRGAAAAEARRRGLI